MSRVPHADALSRNTRVVLFLVESSGAIAAEGLRFLRHLGSEATKPGGLDNTVYGHYGRGLGLREHGFATHHIRMISLAATTTHAAIIAHGAVGVRRRAMLA